MRVGGEEFKGTLGGSDRTELPANLKRLEATETRTTLEARATGELAVKTSQA